VRRTVVPLKACDAPHPLQAVVTLTGAGESFLTSQARRPNLACPRGGQKMRIDLHPPPRGLVALITCRECGGTMSDLAPACPRCGAPAAGSFAGPGAARRAHGWEGMVYVGVGYLAAVSFALSGLLFLVLPLTSEPRIRDTAQPGMILASFGGMAVLAYACARGVRRFRAWGWWLATGLSTLAVLTCVYALLRPPVDTATDASSVRIGALLVLAFHAVFLRYFLARHRDFGIGT